MGNGYEMSKERDNSFMTCFSCLDVVVESQSSRPKKARE